MCRPVPGLRPEIDPDFDRNLAAFYYTQMIGILTPLWTTFDEVRVWW